MAPCQGWLGRAPLLLSFTVWPSLPPKAAWTPLDQGSNQAQVDTAPGPTGPRWEAAVERRSSSSQGGLARWWQA